MSDSPSNGMTAAGWLRWLALVVAAFLLTSIGGAGIVASPVTLPLLYVASKSSASRGFRIGAALVGCLTGVEAGFGLAYISVGYGNRYWWMTSVAMGLVSLAVFGKLVRESSRQDPPLHLDDRT